MKDLEIFRPDRFYDAIWDIDFEFLASEGLRNLIIDVDNTIAKAGVHEMEPKAVETIQKLKKWEPPFSICLVSNVIFGKKRIERVEKFAEELDLPFVAVDFKNRKPKPYPFEKGMDLLGSSASNTVVIGDQVLTDIQGGNFLGLYTILIRPLGDDHWINSVLGTRKKEKEILEALGVLEEV